MIISAKGKALKRYYYTGIQHMKVKMTRHCDSYSTTFPITFIWNGRTYTGTCEASVSKCWCEESDTFKGWGLSYEMFTEQFPSSILREYMELDTKKGAVNVLQYWLDNVTEFYA